MFENNRLKSSLSATCQQQIAYINGASVIENKRQLMKLIIPDVFDNKTLQNDTNAQGNDNRLWVKMKHQLKQVEVFCQKEKPSLHTKSQITSLCSRFYHLQEKSVVLSCPLFVTN